MPTEGFFSRWSRLKTEPAPAHGAGEGAQQAAQALPAGPGAAVVAPATPAAASDAPGAPARLPTLDDVASLGADSDYSAFVARGVDKSVRRSAMKKLFADPHFNIGDGLDLYMGDYNRADPIPAAMMSALRHTESFFAQAYPDRKAEKERELAVAGACAGADAEHAGANAAAAHRPHGQPAPAATGGQPDTTTGTTTDTTNPEPPMADTTGASSANEGNT